MEADLQRFYRVDLRDLWRPGAGLTLRRVWVLVAALPPDSALAIEDNGGTRPLAPSEYLLGDVWRELNVRRMGRRARGPHPLIRAQSDARKTRDLERKRVLLEQAAGRDRERRRRLDEKKGR